MQVLTLREKFEHEFLGIDPRTAEIANPFDNRTPEDVENPHLHLLRVMRDPKYVFFTCKALMNRPGGQPLELFPFQCAVIQELWYRPLPMIIAHRGWGKCISADAYVVTNRGMVRIGDVVGDAEPMRRKYTSGLRLLGEDGFGEVEYCWNNGRTETRKIETRMGYSLEATPNHPVRVVRGDGIEWVQAGGIRVGDYIPIDRGESWSGDITPLDPGTAYLFGLLVGDGCYTETRSNWIGFTTADADLAGAISVESESLWGKRFTKDPSNAYGYSLYGKEIRRSLFDRFGFRGTLSGDKDFPASVMSAGRESVAAFIRGLMDTDGTACKSYAGVEFASKSRRLAETLHFVLLRFGIVSRLKTRHNRKYERDYYYLRISGQDARLFADRIGFGLRRKQERLVANCLRATNANIDVIPSGLVGDDLMNLRDRWSAVRPPAGRGYSYARSMMMASRLKMYDLTYEHLDRVLAETESISHAAEWSRLDRIARRRYFYDVVESVEVGETTTYDVHMKSDDDRSFISNGMISHNSFLLALYALLRATFLQGRKVVIIGSGFRQAKGVFQYAETIWNNSPVFRSLFADSPSSGPRHDSDRWMLRLGDSTVTALPLGDGCLNEHTLMLYQDGFSTISAHSGEVWGNGRWRPSDHHHDNGVRPTKIVTTKKGYRFEGTHNHKMRVYRNGVADFVRSDEMVIGDRILIDRSTRWHDAPEVVGDEEAYSLGLMIGDGSYCNGRLLRFTTQSREMIAPLRRGAGLPFKQTDRWHWDHCGRAEADAWRERWGLGRVKAIDKELPPRILGASREAMSACLSGLFDTDGGVQVQTSRGGTAITISLTSTSRRLMEQVHYILLHYGIVSHLGSRDRGNPKWNRSYEMQITGPDARKFHEQIGFRLRRKATVLASALSSKARDYGRGDTLPDVRAGMLAIARKYRIRRGRGTRKTASVSGRRIQQLKGITHRLANAFCDVYGELVEGDEERAFLDRLRALANTDVFYDEIASIEDGESHTFDIHVPDGNEYCGGGFFSHNSAIRGERANDLLTDEFGSVPWEIYETSVKPFTAVEMDPMGTARRKAEIRVMKREGLWTEELSENERTRRIGNQSIISGTAYYQFNHFFDYWKRWKTIIESGGDRKKLDDAFGGRADEIDYRDYSIIRVPYELAPDGFLSDTIVNDAKATYNTSVFLNEYSAVFSSDSNGFFKRSLIESCVTKVPIEPLTSPGEAVQFRATTKGNPAGHYVYGIDPAFSSDRFSIVVLEVHPTHRRVVYCWTTTASDHRDRLRAGLTKSQDFYGFCARKVRELMKAFPCEHIALDSQGGGTSVAESLHDPDKMEGEEKPIWMIAADHPLSDRRERESDGYPGLHILEMVNFAQADYVREANHGMRKDLEDRVLLFPEYDTGILAIAMHDDQAKHRVFDTLEDAVSEIEELKEELSTISYSQTPGSLRDHWDTPEVKIAGSKKGRLRKDRYSALLMANSAARRLNRQPDQPDIYPIGGFVNAETYVAPPAPLTGKMYVSAPDWFMDGVQGNQRAYGWAVNRSGVED